MHIHVAVCDLTDLPVDAVVNPTNSQGLMSHGVSEMLRQLGGRVIEEEARASAPIAVGAAVVTTGGSLHARHVIHVPTTEEPGVKTTIENVRRATRAALIAAAARGLHSIGLPPMGGDLGSVPDDEAARAMVDELRAHKPPVPDTVYLVTQSAEMVADYEEALRNASNPG